MEIGRWARDLNWRLGLRLHFAEEFDPDEPQFAGQFGMPQNEAIQALALLQGLGLNVSGLHFHLRSNVESADVFRRALSEAASFCRSAHWSPEYVDTGGGLPDPGVTAGVDAQYLSDFGHAIDDFARKSGNVKEVWMEHGRFVSGRSAVLVVRVIDSKLRPECRYLICDGGRTNQALVSDWESHPLYVLPHRNGPSMLTTVTGPTCMAYDRLARLPLPEDAAIGDLIVWTHAGAYHLPWETRFSRGLCRVIWCSANDRLELVRDEESFENWWGQWA
jgi:ornithine decarboxylase